MASTVSYAQVIADTETSHSSAVRRTHKSSLVGRVSLRGGLALYETFSNSVKLNFGRRCLGYRPIDSLNSIPGQFLFRTYAEIYRSVRYMASGMVKESLLNPNSENLLTLGIFLKNSPTWIVAENAAYYLNAVVVPLYDTLGTDTLEFIMNQTELQTIVCSSKELRILKRVAPLCPKLRTVIVSDLSIPITVCAEMMNPVGIRVISLHNLERIGEAYQSPPSPPIPSDIATICFTSGTTGMPKGAIISHQNMVSVMAAGLEGVILARPDDLYLSFLPLPHIFERIVVNSLLASGAGVGSYRGDITKVVEDLAALQPTVFCAVPRLYTRIHDRIALKISEEKGISGKVLRLALSTKSKNFRENGEVKHGLWDRLVFQKIKVSLGLQNVRLIISGGAPLPAATMEFFRILMGEGATYHEGYGQTETTGATSITYPEDLSRGHVGGPFPNCEIRLEDVPDMGYLHSDRMHGDIPCEGRGEV
jgi:long-chain acyl-CoA synthetase